MVEERTTVMLRLRTETALQLFRDAKRHGDGMASAVERLMEHARKGAKDTSGAAALQRQESL